MAANSKNILPVYHNVVASQMSVNITSPVTDIRWLDNPAFQFIFTGTPTGTFAIQGSLSYLAGTGGTVLNSGTWDSISLPNTPTAAGAAGSILINLSELAIPYIKFIWTSTATGVQTIATVADVSKSLASKYFLLSDEQGNNYAIWFKVSGTGSAPTVAGYTTVEQDISTGDTAATIGAALATTIAALNSTNSFNTSGTTTVTVTNKVAGPFTLAVDGNTGFTIACTAGSGLLDAYISGKAV